MVSPAFSSTFFSPLSTTLMAAGSHPLNLVPQKFDLEDVTLVGRPGALTIWGDTVATGELALGNRDFALARTAVDIGIVRELDDGLFETRDGRRLSQSEVVAEFEPILRTCVGPRRLPLGKKTIVAKGKEGESIRVLTDFGGQIPHAPEGFAPQEGFRPGFGDIQKFMNLTKEGVAGASFERSYKSMIKTADPDTLLGLYATTQMLIHNALSFEEAFPGSRKVGVKTGRGMPGVFAFVRLVEAALQGKPKVLHEALPNVLQSAMMGVILAILGPKGDEIPSVLDPFEGVRTMGSNAQGSWECATGLGLMVLAADQIGSRKRGQLPYDGQLVVVGEATHGPDHARLAAVGFNALGAMETTRHLEERSKDPKNPDYWGAYAPFAVSNGFWPGQGGAALMFYGGRAALLGESRGGRLVRAPILPLLDANLLGYSLYPDQGGKTNHAQMGIGIVNAILESTRMAYEGHGIGIQDLGGISFHGTATADTTTKEPLILVQVLKSLGFEKGKKRIKATALKGLLTHGLGVAGEQEAAVILYALRKRRFPGMFNIAGRDLLVPEEIQEWIDFSEGSADSIDVAMLLSEGFSGNNAAMLLEALGDEGLEKLLRYRGITLQHIRDLREAQVHKALMADDLERQIRSGELSFTKLLEWSGFKDRSSRGVASFPGLKRDLAPETEAPLSEGAKAFRLDLDRLSFQSSRWVAGVLTAIRKELSAANESEFSHEIQRLDFILDSLREADPNAFFAGTGLPYLIREIGRTPSALETLAVSESVREAIEGFFNPKPIAKIETRAIETDPTKVDIPMADRRVVMSFPGQGAFDTEKRSRNAKTLYDSKADYRRVIDEAHDRLKKHGYDLKRMLFEGSQEEFLETRHQQPILAADELARAAIVREHLRKTDTTITVAYGDSLGLIPAAFEAGWFETEADAIEFAFIRGDVMAGLNPFGPEARPMALIAGYEEGRVRQVVGSVSEDLGTHVVISKMNGVGKLVISGDPAGIALVGSRMNMLGGKVTIIPVSTPFHDSHYFADAAVKLLSRARETGIHGSRRHSDVSLIANSTGVAVPDDADILELLAGEIAKPVDLVTSQQTASSLGGNIFLEVGPKAIVTNDVAASLGALEEAPPTIAAYISSEEKLNELFPTKEDL